MKTYFHAFAMCQSMFCSIPFPGNIWDGKARDKMLLFLPVVGLEIGAIWAFLAWLSHVLNLPVLIKGLILSVYPYLVTGFIHLDGYMDVTKAGSFKKPQSHASPAQIAPISNPMMGRNKSIFPFAFSSHIFQGQGIAQNIL